MADSPEKKSRFFSLSFSHNYIMWLIRIIEWLPNFLHWYLRIGHITWHTYTYQVVWDGDKHTHIQKNGKFPVKSHTHVVLSKHLTSLLGCLDGQLSDYIFHTDEDSWICMRNAHSQKKINEKKFATKTTLFIGNENQTYVYTPKYTRESRQMGESEESVWFTYCNIIIIIIHAKIE